eukprot:9143807-Pyramimonas_sp.AAC.4
MGAQAVLPVLEALVRALCRLLDALDNSMNPLKHRRRDPRERYARGKGAPPAVPIGGWDEAEQQLVEVHTSAADA